MGERIGGYHDDDIVIVGLALHTSAGDSPEAFWESISNGADCIGSISGTRKDDLINFLKHKNKADDITLSEGGLIRDIDLFDNQFFHIRELDALCSSPCLRMHLEVMWKALEDAGYTENDLNGAQIDVYTGIVTDAQIYEYREIVKAYRKSLLPVAINGNLLPVIPASLAYYLNLKGITAVTDTACTSSSTALIQASNALKAGQCKAAVVAGGRLIYMPVDEPDERIGIESLDFRARPFDETAEGTVHGEGVAALVVKKYSQAVLDNDRIYAVIKGGASNQSGKTARMGITDPKAQKEAVLNGLQNAGLRAEDIQYCETHGTGTYFGDSLELSSIETAFWESTEKRGFCGVGSIKGNIGHTYGASGIISMIKCIMAMKNGIMPPTPNMLFPNKKINFIDSPFFVNVKRSAWQAEQKRCMVNCYGISGVNCCFFLEDYKYSIERKHPSKRILPVALTAKNLNSLKMLLAAYSQYLKSTDHAFEDISYSAMVRRNHFKHKLLFLVQNKEELLKQINDCIAQINNTDFIASGNQKASFYSNKMNRKKTDYAALAISFRENGSESDLRKLCDLYLNGCDIEWKQIYDSSYSYVTLPSYTFDRHRIWVTEETLNQIAATFDAEDNAAKEVVSSEGEVSDKEKELGALLMEYLHVSKVDVDENLFSFGLDSISGTKLINRVNEKYHIALSVINLFESDTIRKLAAAIGTEKKHADFVLFHAEKKESYDLSAAQSRIYLQDRLIRNNRKTLLQGVYMINGIIDTERLEKAVQQIIRNNEILRTALIDLNGKPQQVVKKNWEFQIETGKQILSIEEEMRSFVTVFDLSKPPFFRIKVLDTEDGRNVFMFSAHHSIFDGTSVLVFLDQLDAYYSGKTFPQNVYTYADYAESMKEYYHTEAYALQREYWEKQYEKKTIVSNLPKSYDIAETTTETRGKKHYFTFSKSLTERIVVFAAKKKTTVFMELYAAMVILLHQYSGDSDICLGIPYAGRKNAAVEKMLGVFINTLAVHTNINQQDKVDDLIEKARNNCVMAFKNADYGYEELVKKTGGDPFNVMFIFQNTGERIFRLGEQTGEEYDLRESEAKYDMTVEMFPINGMIQGNVEFNTALVSEKYVERMISHLQNILEKMAEDDNCSVEDISLLNREQTREILELGRGDEHAVSYTVIDMWYNALQNPHAEAIRFRGESFSYAQLNEMSDRVADYILKNLCLDGKMLPVLMHRSEKLIAVLIGILKAGYSYIPVDPQYPENRISYIIQNSGAETILTDRECGYCNEAIKMIVAEDIIENNNLSDLSGKGYNCANFDEVSYTIYTSGTTGNPKGVSVRHRELANFVQAMDAVEHFACSDKILCVTTVCFDIFVLECFCTLCSGACIVLADENECTDVNRLACLIKENNVRVIQFTPSRMQVILLSDEGRSAMKQLRTIFLGGESLNTDVLNKLKNLTDARIINMYGPTETTVWSAYKDVTHSDTITIGRPLENTNIYILNDQAALQYRGGVGEIAIGGKGVSKGYMRNEKLTTDKYIELAVTGERVYKTGDLGRWEENGDLICLGRNDHQVKIRGYRVELGEIEEIINQHEAIVKAAAVTKEVSGNHVLLVFVKTVDDEPADEEQLMKYAAAHLPHYMIPYAFIQVKEFPYTPNKKLDRNALAATDLSQCSFSKEKKIVLPKTYIEKTVYDVWKMILEKDDFGCNQDFFRIGGNSLLLILMLSELKKRYAADISVADLYECRTITAIAQLINDKNDSSIIMDDADSEENALPDDLKVCELSGAQLRLYLLEQMDPVKCKYNIPSAFLVSGKLDIDKLENAVNVVISRHEILRTSFEMIGDTPMQRIHDEVRFEINRGGQIKDIDAEIQKFIREFDLEVPPLIHAMIGDIDEKHMLFLFDMHHLITDATSAQLFIQEVESVYNGLPLGQVKQQYKSFAHRSNRYTKTDDYKKQEQYWKQVFQEKYKKRKLPNASAHQKTDGSKGKNYCFTICHDLCDKIKQYANQRQYTEFMILIAALVILLYKYTGADDLTIGTPVFGRNSQEENEMLGVFINTLVLRNHVRNPMSVHELFESAKKMTLQALGNSGYGFQDLVQQVSVERNLDQNPLFDIMFVYQIFGEKEICLGDAKFRKYQIKNIVPKYEMSFEMIPDADCINCVLEYDSGLYSEKYVKAFTEHYLNILDTILTNDAQQVQDICIENEEQLMQIVEHGQGAEFAVSDTVVDFWYKNLERHPEAIAVVNSGKRYSYAELERTSNIIANYLLDHFDKTDMTFCVLMKREYLLIAALLGILKAGGSYIPIDVSYPEDRIMYILNSTNATAYLSTSATEFCYNALKTVYIDAVTATYNKDNAVNACKMENTAYTIFTSGSTGNPKGVVIGQKSMSNFVQAINRMEPFDADTRMLGVTTVSFDIFVLECYVTLCFGGSLILADDMQTADVGELSKCMVDEKVNVIQFTPSRIMMILEIPEYAECLRKIRTVFVGGEALTEDTLERLRSYTDARLINVYGPTETTVWSTFKDVTHVEEITIGSPIDNTDVYILDENNRLMFRNGIGELAIGGLGVAKGYFNNNSLTDERFIRTPFAKGRIYKTGDLAGWDDNGELLCLGRIDNQVKIRGYRVELEEIDHVILSFNKERGKNLITRSVTIVKKTGGVNDLYTFVEIDNQNSITDVSELKRFAESKLPFYMVPKVITIVDNIPFTNNGKVDRKALHNYETEEPVFEQAFKSPETSTEEKLYQIWSDVLNINQFSCDQKFFEIGGNSLLLIRLLKMIREEFDIEITAGELFKLQTIRNTAEWLDHSIKMQIQCFKDIEIPEKLAGNCKKSGISYNSLQLDVKESEPEAFSVYIRIFAKIMSLLCKTDTVGLNISAEKDRFSVIDLSAEDINSIDNKKAISAALSSEGNSLSAYVSNVQKKRIKLLFAANQNVNNEKLLKIFDVIVQMKYADGMLRIETAYNNLKMNKSAVNYIMEKTIVFYEKYYKL